MNKKLIEDMSFEENIESRFNSGMTPKLWILVGLVIATITFVAWVAFIATMFVKAYG